MVKNIGIIKCISTVYCINKRNTTELRILIVSNESFYQYIDKSILTKKVVTSALNYRV